jgi:hypothetical protein
MLSMDYLDKVRHADIGRQDILISDMESIWEYAKGDPFTCVVVAYNLGILRGRRAANIHRTITGGAARHKS